MTTMRTARSPVPPASPSTSTPAAEPAGYAADDAVWDVPWLAELRDVPPDATWPRLMTRPHPDAVGSYGDVWAASVAARTGTPARWWQRLVATRLLEHDAEGLLVWLSALVSTARQVGKSFTLRELCNWRLEEAGDLFTPEQLILHVARKLSLAVEVQRPARRRAHRVNTAAKAADTPEPYKVREVNGEQQIERRDDGSRWTIRAKDNVVGLTVDNAHIDEAWDVSAVLVETDLVPTMVERPSAQLVLWSTAHRKATSLVLNRRATLDVADVAGGLHIEWSAPRDVELDDRAGWRMASPHWTARREALIANRLAAARNGETDDPDEPDPVAAFTSQWLNWWPLRRAPVGKGEPLLPDGAWAACAGALDDAAAGFVALEDYFGRGAAAAFAAGDGTGRFEVDGVACESWDQAIDLARQFVVARPGSGLIVGVTMRAQVPADFPNRAAMRVAGQSETHRALPLLRALVTGGQVVHDDTADLDAQLDEALVRPLPSGGLAFASTARSDLLRAALWALDACQTPTPTPAIR